MEIARKITVGGINGIRKGFKGITAITLVARIYGIAAEVARESGQLGEYWKFTGEFQAVNQDGEMHAAPVLMLPAPADDMLAAAVKNAEGSVKFGFDIYVEPREDVAIGYSFKIKPLLEVKPSNPLADLMSVLPALPDMPKKQAPLQLEQPTETAAPKVDEKTPETVGAESETPAKPAAKGKAAK